jgi:succinoglycan biosynthesis protein ExoM
VNVTGGKLCVAVCVATCRRPRSLGRLLRSLEGLTFEGEEPHVGVILIDNDPEGSARPLFEELVRSFRWTLRYELEPRQNISHARNRALDAAADGGADLLVFVDDDEIVSPGWLDHLLEVRAQTGAPIVAGPITFAFDPETPAWIRDGRFFEVDRHATGASVGMAFTGNVLIAREYFIRPEVRFDPKFGISGGGDSHFFTRAVLDGVSIVWADEAVVEEAVPASRATARWILRRAYRVGNRTVRLERDLLPRRRWLAPRFARASVRILEGVVLLPLALLAGRAAAVRSLRKVAHGVGCIAGIAGVEVNDYGKIHGS